MRKVLGVILPVVFVSFGLAGCSFSGPSASEVAGAVVDGRVSAADFLAGDAKFGRRSIDSVAVTRTWLFDDAVGDAAATGRAVAKISSEASKSNAGKRRWAQILSEAVTRSAGECSNLTIAAVDGSRALHRRPAGSAIRVIGEWIGSVLDSFAVAPSWFVSPPQDWTSKPLPGSGPVLGQPWGNWWCLTSVIRTDPDTEERFIADLATAYATYESRLATAFLTRADTPGATLKLLTQSPDIADPMFGLERFEQIAKKTIYVCKKLEESGTDYGKDPRYKYCPNRSRGTLFGDNERITNDAEFVVGPYPDPDETYERRWWRAYMELHPDTPQTDDSLGVIEASFNETADIAYGAVAVWIPERLYMTLYREARDARLW